MSDAHQTDTYMVGTQMVNNWEAAVALAKEALKTLSVVSIKRFTNGKYISTFYYNIERIDIQ
jgi:hypothetical protein